VEVRAGDLAQVEPREHGVSEVKQAKAEAVAAGRLDVLDETRRGQGREQARDGAGMEARAARQLVRAELGAAVGERVEQRDGPLDRGHPARGWLSRAGHASVRSYF
jgi:hypothetical protein